MEIPRIRSTFSSFSASSSTCRVYGRKEVGEFSACRRSLRKNQLRYIREHNYNSFKMKLAYPETLVRVENKTIYTNVVAFTGRVPTAIEEKNPAPGVCLPIIVTFCTYHKVSLPRSTVVHVPSAIFLEIISNKLARNPPTRFSRVGSN